MPESAIEEKHEEFQPWRCEHPLKYPIPKKKGDLWERLLKPQLQTDKEICNIWKDEVENLLIFAGLFSAVVTAFIIESYKRLQPDTDQAIVALLSHIATSLDNPRNTSSSVAIPSLSSMSNAPSSAISRANILWFISLILSLTDVLAGTVSLQWLREHQRYPAEKSAKDRLAIFNMRQDGFRDWYVPQIFLILPMLLQLSLVLFLVGLINFLLVVAPPNVSTPIIATTGLPILFLVVTIVIPSIQWTLSPSVFYRVFRRIPSQCPYKSPQSYAIGSIIAPIIVILADASLAVFVLGWRAVEAIRRPSLFWMKGPGLVQFRRHHYRPSHFKHKMSLQSDDMALYYRERCHKELYKSKVHAQWESELTATTLQALLPSTHDRKYPLPLYDWIAGLKASGIKRKSDIDFQAACYHCMHEITTDPSFNYGIGDHHYFQNMLIPEWPDCDIRLSDTYLARSGNVPYEDYDSYDVGRVLSEEMCISIASSLCTSRMIPAQFLTHIHELYIRIANSHFQRQLSRPKIKLYGEKGTYVPKWTKFTVRILPPWRQPLPGFLKDVSAFSQQYTSALCNLFEANAFPFLYTQFMDDIAARDISYAVRSFYHVKRFIATAVNNQDYNGKEATLDCIEKILAQYNQPSNTSSATPTPTPTGPITPLPTTGEGPSCLLLYLMCLYLGMLKMQNKERDFRQDALILALGKQSQELFDIEPLEFRDQMSIDAAYVTFIRWYKVLAADASRLSTQRGLWTDAGVSSVRTLSLRSHFTVLQDTRLELELEGNISDLVEDGIVPLQPVEHSDEIEIVVEK